MPRRDRARAPLGFWRIAGLVLAAALGLAAVCLVVFGDSQKQLQVGVLLGLWGGLIGAFMVYGSRRSQVEQAGELAEAEYRANRLHEAQLQVSQLQQAQLEAANESRAKQEIELRKLGEVQLSREVAARREADLNLEISLRREIEKMMTEHIGALRDEVAALRAEVVEKLGGELRLERIETTRLIGSDLEALQHEIRRLAGSQESIGHAPSAVSAPLPHLARETILARENGDFSQPPMPAGRPARRREDVADIVDAEVIEADQHSKPASTERPAPQAPPAPAPAPAARRAPAAEAARAAEPVSRPEPAPDRPVPAGWSASTVVDPLNSPDTTPTATEPAPRSVPPLYRQSEQVAAFTSSFDPFAGLPRLSPLPDDIDLIADERVAAQPGSAGRRRAPDEHPDDDPEPAGNHSGRRRAPDEPAPMAEEQPAGRRRASDERGGRRRAPDDAPDDLMARLTDR